MPTTPTDTTGVGRIVPIAEAEAAGARRRRGGGGRPRKYPWDVYLDGHARHLQQGVHFDCKVDSFTTLFWRQARSIGLRARWHIDYDDMSVVIWAEDRAGRSLVDPTEGDPALLYEDDTEQPRASGGSGSHAGEGGAAPAPVTYRVDDATLDRAFEAITHPGTVDPDTWMHVD